MAPVVSAALGALGPLLVKLTGLVAGEYGRLKGVRREIQLLQSELTSMHTALEEYTELEDPSGQVQAWISLVRELAYDTEDVFDKFIHQLRKGGHRGGFKGFLRNITLPLKKLGDRRSIADQIDDLKVRIKQVKELKDCYKLNEAPSSTTHHVAVDPRLHALFADEAHLVGVDGPRDELAKWMVDGSSSSKHCNVLSIVGFGGLGKTTLANEVYRKIKGQFDCWAFVSVSQKPDIKKIIKDVISEVSGENGFTKDIYDWDERKSIAKLRELLHNKRYLIVIDDIWSTQAWNTIKCAFPDNNYSSRIIATTRIVDVAKSCCPSFEDRLYVMEALDELHSRRLFLKRIFGSDDHCPDMLNEVSTEILKKCGGIPLAIISISSLLANKPIVKEGWEKVKRSIGYAMENDQNLEGMNSILSLSYNDLPPILKTCLLYLSVFPEDCVIDRKRLVRRWIAEGFISKEHGKSQYEVADSYFYELINKSMVQPVDPVYTGDVHACRVHDMMLEIIISKSAEDNFTTVVRGGQQSLLNRHGIIRRLSVQYIDQELASALANEDLSHVRSLTVTSSDCIKHLPSLAKFEALRVLDFEDCKGVEQYDMNSVEKLFQLKYLGLMRTGISRLPSGIVMLSDLETLDFRWTSVHELPAGFVKLTKLRHLGYCPSFDDRLYVMEALDELHSRRLFLKRIFGSDDHCPEMLNEVSSEILKKCGGIPLAIISISSLLASKPIVKEEWEKVKRSIGYAMENDQSLEGMNSILSLSYNDLPPNLKTCLLYLSVFPEDYVIDRKRLVRRWIAEGFISEERGKSQYEVAESYFYELINKNMVQTVDPGYAGEVHACRVHDMILEIIISKSAEDNFITVVGGGQKSLLNRRKIIRRLSVQYIDQELASALANEDLSHVRSLTITTSDCIKYLPSLAEFEALRVLDFEGCNGLQQYDMNSVQKLFQLKYLGLAGTGISSLPSGIVMLSDLETLDFRWTSVQEMPAGFVKLTKLRHLLAGRKTKIPSGIGNMDNLRVISQINATMSSADALEELGNLTCLSELFVHLECGGSICGGPDAYRTHEEKLFSSLHKLIMSSELRSLRIYSRDNHSFESLESWSPMPSALQDFCMSTSYYFTDIPKWIGPALASLASLDINLTELSEDGLRTLSELPALLCLILWLKPGGCRITVIDNCFPSLKLFGIISSKGTYVTFVKGAMPKLECLHQVFAVSVGRNHDFYLGLVNLPCLKRVTIVLESEGATLSEIIAARTAIKEEVHAHANHPREFFHWRPWRMENFFLNHLTQGN